LNLFGKEAFPSLTAPRAAAEIAGLFRVRWVVPCRPVSGPGALAWDLRHRSWVRWRRERQTLKIQDFLPALARSLASFPGRIRRVAQGLPGGELNDVVDRHA
jgi:hypothetical protein